MYGNRFHDIEIKQPKIPESLNVLKEAYAICVSKLAGLEKDIYDEISNFVNNNLSNKKTVLFNESYNIISNIYEILSKRYLFDNIASRTELDFLFKSYNSVLEELSAYNKDLTILMQDYRDKHYKHYKNFKDINKTALDADTAAIKTEINKIAEKDLDINQIKKYTKIFNDIVKKAGYHNIEAYWIDNKTLCFVKDDFTSKIDNFKDFAVKNNLPDVNYGFITNDKIKILQVKHDIWVRYNPTKQEEANFNKLKTTLIKDKLNFNAKFKLCWFY